MISKISNNIVFFGKKGICYKKGTAPLPYDQSHVKLMGFQGIIEFKGWACCVKEVERGRAPFVIEQFFCKTGS